MPETDSDLKVGVSVSVHESAAGRGSVYVVGGKKSFSVVIFISINSYLVDGSGQLSGQLKKVHSLIVQKPGIIAKDISKELGRPYRTVIKQIYKLENLSIIERRGSKKTGGYYGK